MADEGFHEIQLNGKQLVFLFMAATVVAVVIFLCGVMVGRGVRVQRGAIESAALAEGVADPTAEARPPRMPDPVPTSATSDAAPAPTAEVLSYPDRLAGNAPAEKLSERRAGSAPAERSSERPAGSAPPARAPEPPRARSAADRPSATTGFSAPSGPAGGFAVQVAAVRERDEAETIARRLSRKGYKAYVIPPAAGAPRVFRVRVGNFKDRREAEQVATRLEREEQFKPWITR